MLKESIVSKIKEFLDYKEISYEINDYSNDISRIVLNQINIKSFIDIEARVYFGYPENIVVLFQSEVPEGNPLYVNRWYSSNSGNNFDEIISEYVEKVITFEASISEIQPNLDKILTICLDNDIDFYSIVRSKINS